MKTLYVFNTRNKLIETTTYGGASIKYRIPIQKIYFRQARALPFKHKKSVLFFSIKPEFKIPERHIAANIDLSTMSVKDAAQSLSATFGSVWKRIKGYDGCYWVSRDGRVVGRRGRLLRYFIHKREKGSNPNIGVGLTENMHLKDSGGETRHVVKVSRLVGLSFIPNPKKHRWLLCKDGNWKNLDASNWFWSKGSPHPNTYVAPLISVKCPNCQADFQAKDYQTRQKYCSRKCTDEGRRNRKLSRAQRKTLSKAKMVPIALISRKHKGKRRIQTLKFSSINNAAKHIGCTPGHLSNMINNKYRNSTGYKFKIVKS